ncbi:uncharacterized protein CBO05P1_258 [Clostridium botulinum B str. Osaka05]|uniref:Uncharacterized protein n=2 Tax=Clostridium botulinum TaxID=1491 RepID=A0A060N529_CLOBO|nr:uncharacterized protein CBO05P1_258 [Clostridium botulinum B str. Osaka05]
MINNCKEDRLEMAKEIAEVRKTGETNMLIRSNVINILYSLGYDFTADYIQNERTDYINLLKLSGDF